MTENNNDALTQPNENTDSEIIAQLGQSRLVSIASSLSLTKTSVILKEGTLTGMGVQENNKTFFKGDLEDLTSISIEIFREIPLLIVGLILLPAYGFGLIFLILYLIRKQRTLKLNFHGEVYSLPLKGYKDGEVEEFIDTILDAKRKL